MLLPRTASETGIARGRWRTGCSTQGALRDELFDCVPLDVLMPELDGYQVLEHIRSDPSRSGTRLVIVVSPPLEYVETLNAGSLFDKLTARQALP